MDKENRSGIGRGGRLLDEFDVYFARAALDASRDENDADDVPPAERSPSESLQPLVRPEEDETRRKNASIPRRSVSCKYPSRKKSVSPKRDSALGSPVVGPHSPKAPGADPGLCASLLGVWTSARSSSSAPQSRSSSWRKLKRPRSFRDSDHHHHHHTGSSSPVEGNLEEAIFDRLQQLKLMKEADCCVVRSFNTSAKGNIVDKYDMFKRIADHQTPPPPPSPSPSSVLTSLGGSAVDVTNVDAAAAAADHRRKTGSRSDETGNGSMVPYGRAGTTSDVCKVVVIGQSHVGKTALIQQFMTSHYMAAVCTSFDDEADKTVCVILNGEETTMNFIDSGAPTKQEYLEYVGRSDVDAYLLVYSITALASFRYACEVLCDIRCAECPGGGRLLQQPAIILVANKSDLVRTKQVSETEAKYVCQWLDCKYIAVSASLNHRVDDLLVGIVRQIKRNRRTKVEGGHFSDCADARAGGANQRCFKGAKEILKELFRGDFCVPPSSSCDNLYEL